eukprot:5049822-Amphidinium_carterae.1
MAPRWSFGTASEKAPDDVTWVEDWPGLQPRGKMSEYQRTPPPKPPKNQNEKKKGGKMGKM